MTRGPTQEVGTWAVLEVAEVGLLYHVLSELENLACACHACRK